uniref:Uncharacterized protein n=1 Tax=Micromonas pusilla TaxID=38833 RepID=A0A7R9Y1W2_MICPS
MPAACAISESFSMSISTKCTSSPYSSNTLSSIGFRRLHGPQFGPLYSTMSTRSLSWYSLRNANWPLCFTLSPSNVALLSSSTSPSFSLSALSFVSFSFSVSAAAADATLAATPAPAPAPARGDATMMDK